MSQVTIKAYWKGQELGALITNRTRHKEQTLEHYREQWQPWLEDNGWASQGAALSLDGEGVRIDPNLAYIKVGQHWTVTGTFVPDA